MTAFLLSIGPALAKFAAICAAIIGALSAIRRDARKDARQETALEAAERYAKTIKATDNADTGVGATDLQRIARLREFADDKP